MATTQKISGAGGTTTSFSNTPQASDDNYSLGEDSLSTYGVDATHSTVFTLDVMSNDSGGAAKSLYSIDDGTSASTATKVPAPSDLATADALTGGISAWEASGTDGILIRINNGKVEVDITGYLTDHGYSSLDALPEGAHISESFTYAIKLGNGTLSWATASFDIAGSNDAPTLSAITSGSIAEVDQSSATTDGGLSGTLSATDPDVGDTHTFGIDGGADNNDGTVSYVGSYGTLTVDTTTGAYSYVKDSGAIEALDAGDSKQDTFTISVTDNHNASDTQTFTVNITGADDAPTLAEVQSGSITEVDQSTTTTDLYLTGTLSGADVDADDTLTYGIVGGTDNGDGTVSLAGDYGKLTVDTTTGAYHFDKDAAAVEALIAGQHETDTFTFTVWDGDGDPVTQGYTVDLYGANEAPTGPTIATPVDPTTTGDPNDFDNLGTNGPNTIPASIGNGVDNTYYGGTGDDTVNGGTGNDTIYGGSGNDTLNGNPDLDHIYGGSGSDTINGGQANDVIIGGWSVDYINVADNNDTVAYLSVLDTGDRISGFGAGDKLDFSAIDANPPAAPNDAFSVTAGTAVVAHGINYFFDGTDTQVWADTDGNTGTVELAVTLVGVDATATLGTPGTIVP